MKKYNLLALLTALMLPVAIPSGMAIGESGLQQTSIAPLILINASLVTALAHQVGPFMISFDPGRPYKSIRATGPFRLLGPDGKTWYTHYVLFCYSDNEGVMIDTAITINKFDLPVFDLSGEFPTKAVYSDLVSSWKADPNTIYVVQRSIDGKPGAVGWGYLPTGKVQGYSINWYISPTSVAHVEVWDGQEAGSILNSIHIAESTTGATLMQMPGYEPAKNSTSRITAVNGYTATNGANVTYVAPGVYRSNLRWW